MGFLLGLILLPIFLFKRLITHFLDTLSAPISKIGTSAIVLLVVGLVRCDTLIVGRMGARTLQKGIHVLMGIIPSRRRHTLIRFIVHTLVHL